MDYSLVGWWSLLPSYNHQRTPKFRIILVMFWSVLLKRQRKKKILVLFRHCNVADYRNKNIPTMKEVRTKFMTNCV